MVWGDLNRDSIAPLPPLCLPERSDWFPAVVFELMAEGRIISLLVSNGQSTC